MSMRVAVVYNTTKHGNGYWPYTEQQIQSLRNQCSRVGHDLTVIGIDRPLYHQPEFSGWWSKMLAYAPEYADLRPMLVLDIDNFIMRSLDPILELDPAKLWLIRKFLSREHEPEMGLCTVPKSDLADAIWQTALANDKSRPPGDLMKLFPFEFMVDVVDGIYSYKKHCEKECRTDARAVLFHGTPKPPDVTGWALDWWLTSLNSLQTN